MTKPITNAQLKFNCPVNWDNMEDTAGGKNCHQCKKKVFDLTNCTRDEMDVILIQNNYKICAKFTASQIKNFDTKTPLWKKWASAAIILLGINISNNRAVAQTVAVVSGDNMYNSIKPPMVIGEVRIFPYDSMPKFPGGIPALNAFLKNNLDFKNSEPDVYVSFDIDSTGKVNGLRIYGLKITDAETAKIIKLSPRWSPAVDEKKVVAISYTLKVAVKQ